MANNKKLYSLSKEKEEFNYAREKEASFAHPLWGFLGMAFKRDFLPAFVSQHTDFFKMLDWKGT